MAVLGAASLASNYMKFTSLNMHMYTVSPVLFVLFLCPLSFLLHCLALLQLFTFLTFLLPLYVTLQIIIIIKLMIMLLVLKH